MNGPKKEISVDDILNEYAQMAGSQTPPKKPHTTIEPGGDQVWRPEPHRAQQESQRNTDPQPVMPSSAGQSANRKKAQSAGSRGARSAASSAAKKKTQPVVSPSGKNPKSGKSGGQKKKKTGIAVFAGLLALIVVGAGGLLGYTYLTNTIFHGVTAGSVEVGGLTLAQAAEKIKREAEPMVEDGRIPVQINDKQYEIAIRDVTGGLDALESAQAAFEVGHTGNVIERVQETVTALFGGQESKLVIKLDEAGLQAKLDAIAAEALTQPQPETWELQGTNLILTMPKPGVSFDRNQVQNAIVDKITKTMDFTPYVVETQLTEPEPLDVAALKQKVDRPAVNAIVDKTDGKTIIPEQNGIVMDTAQAQAVIGDGSAEQYTIPVAVTPAKVTKEVLERALFRDVLASASTSLNTGNTQRTNNVTLAAKYMNGTILNPGEEFSYNDIVGARTPERGFKSAGAYANGKLIDEVGGGVCQPSSTLYMSVLRADLEVTERTNHSLTVAYTPLGQDATVSYGSLDFKFKNDTDYPIKIVAVREGGEMKTKILGTKVDDKTVKLETEILETLTPTTVEKKDASLEPGTKKVDQTAATGYKTVTYKYVTVNGETKKEVANHSSYRKRDKLVLVGPDKTKPPVAPSAPNTTTDSSAKPTTPPESGTTQQPSNGAANGSTTTGGAAVQPEPSGSAEQPEAVPPPEI